MRLLLTSLKARLFPKVMDIRRAHKNVTHALLLGYICLSLYHEGGKGADWAFVLMAVVEWGV